MIPYKCKISVLNIPEGLYATKCCNKESCGGMDTNMYDVAVVCFTVSAEKENISLANVVTEESKLVLTALLCSMIQMKKFKH